jgi:hypothetical protein
MSIMTQIEEKSFKRCVGNTKGESNSSGKELEFRIIPSVEVSKFESLFTNMEDIL